MAKKKNVRMATSEEKKQVIAAIGKHGGWPAQEVDAAISVESGWNARALNPISKAAGLNQIMPFILKRMGWNGTPEAFAALDPLDQLPLIEKYWRGVNKHWKLPGDTYMAMAAPAFVGYPDEHVIYPKGSKAWEQNPVWRPPGGGSITAGSIRAVLLRRLRPTIPPPAPPRPPSAPSV